MLIYLNNDDLNLQTIILPSMAYVLTHFKKMFGA